MKRYLVLLLCFVSCGERTQETVPGDATKGDASAAPDSLKEIQRDLMQPVLAHRIIPYFKAPPEILWFFDNTKVYGMEQLVYGPTSCEVLSRDRGDGIETAMPNAMAWPSYTVPTIGKQYRCQFASAALAAPDWPVVLLWHEGPPIAFPAGLLGLPGCWLHVDLAKAHAVFAGDSPSNLLYKIPRKGTIEFSWVPTSDWLGRTLTLQGLVFVPEWHARSGMLLTQAIRLDVGN